MNTLPDDAPAADEIEVSLFGPGFGECVVVHLGQGHWMVVDSCLNDDLTEPIAVEYLKSIGVDISSHLQIVVATHFHDDHMRGLAQVFRSATNAKVAFSAATRHREFFELIAASERLKTVARDSSLSEIREILDELNTRKNRGKRSQAGPDFWAEDGQTIFRPAAPQFASVVALSPSSQTVTDAAIRLAEMLPTAPEQMRRLPRCTPNDQSIALLVHCESTSILLGADLEAVSDPLRGWKAVVASTIRPQFQASGIKIAHHGSCNGDLDEIWSMVKENSPALLTPYASGPNPLPSDGDVRRLKARTRNVFCTAWPPTRRPLRRRGVDATIREMTRMHRAVAREVGQIRLRIKIGSDSLPNISLFNGATAL